MPATKKYRIGQYVGCKMASGKWKVCRIIQIYEPGKAGPFCKTKTYTEIYINRNNETTFWLDWGGISIPDIFFDSKKDADLWLFKKELSSLKQDLRREKVLTRQLREQLRSLKTDLVERISK